MAEAEIARHVEEAQRALAAARRHRHPSPRPHRAGRGHRAGGDGVLASRGRFRGGRIPDGLSQDPRAVLEAGRAGGRQDLGRGQSRRRRGGRALARPGARIERRNEARRPRGARHDSGRDGGDRGIGARRAARRRRRKCPITRCRAARIRTTSRRRRTARSGTPRRAQGAIGILDPKTGKTDADSARARLGAARRDHRARPRRLGDRRRPERHRPRRSRQQAR